MGTDIHVRVQTLRHSEWQKAGEEPFWHDEEVPIWFPHDDFEAKMIAEYEAKYAETKSVSTLETLIYYRRSWGIGRNYDLFGILADVRNGTGFAGVQLGDGWPSIAPERGLPDDESAEDLGDHSFTWVALSELLAFDWDGTSTRICGVLPLEQYQPGIVPTEYCGDSWGKNMVTVEESELDGATFPEGTRVNVRQWWHQTARQRCADFCDRIIPAWQQLATERGVTPDNFRILIGFDLMIVTAEDFARAEYSDLFGTPIPETLLPAWTAKAQRILDLVTQMGT